VVVAEDFKASKSHNQVSLGVISRLPTTCTEFDAAEIVGVSGIDFHVHVTNRVSADPGPACPSTDATHSSAVFLGNDLPYAKVTAQVNERTVTFAVRE
jgi:hypothetical protein